MAVIEWPIQLVPGKQIWSVDTVLSKNVKIYLKLEYFFIRKHNFGMHKIVYTINCL